MTQRLPATRFPSAHLLICAVTLLGVGCRVAPDSPLFDPCADASGKDEVLYLSGSGDLADIELSGDNVLAEVITTGDYIRSLRASDPGAFELEALLTAREQIELKAGRFSVAEDSLIELRVQLNTEDRHFEGGGFMELADVMPYWMGIFEVREILEGYASEAVPVEGTLSGCVVARSPFARAEVTLDDLRPGGGDEDEE